MTQNPSSPNNQTGWIAALVVICVALVCVYAIHEDALDERVLIVVAMLLGFEQIVRRLIGQYLANGNKPSDPVTQFIVRWYNWTEMLDNDAGRTETKLR